MLCERCKMREASVVLTEVVNGVRTEHNLCSQCATETDLGQFFDTDFPFAKILSGILGITPEAQDPQTQKMNQLACPTCKMTYGEFIKNSQFGCPDCYDTFGLLLNNNIKKLQGSDTHIGKHPLYQKNGHTHAENVETAKEIETNEEKLAILKSRLKEAIEEEEYEAAAQYRDEIKQLKEDMGIA
ncbi:MAG: UvrB/UvrC motif-containing protein [Lachnospiraceae bacterium]|nr:UvrB/UvrC motif-containing protein [Candidatus Fimimorpha excrementavium]